MRQYFGQRWNALTIRKKIATFTGVVFFVCIMSVIFDAWVVNFSLNDFNRILEDNSKTIELVQRLEDEKETFRDYIKSMDNVTWEMLESVMKETEKTLTSMPFDFELIGESRYEQTWSVQNSYGVYQKRRTVFFDREQNQPEYINSEAFVDDLYELYDMQDYLIYYAKNLMQDTLESGSEDYWEIVPTLLSVPWLVAVFGILLFVIILKLSDLMNKTIVSPVMKLVDASKQIADNHFYVEDIEVENQDEIGELVKAFNKMKFATGEYIMALEEKRKTLDLLHEEELERLEVENQLEIIKLELLKSQVNPHFLFNTLNVISGMANLEEAETTEKMIKALSSLFRYNLKTSGFEVPLARELKVVEDYMYLQQMRFGERITYDVVCDADEERTIVPAFTFQPLVENCIIHGLASKEEGGRIRIRIRQKAGMLHIYIGDNGMGMREEELVQLRDRLMNQKNQEKELGGIGLGNIYRRVYAMYADGSMDVYSKYTAGTVVKIVIPQKSGD